MILENTAFNKHASHIIKTKQAPSHMLDQVGVAMVGELVLHWGENQRNRD
jgi:hypothetical protein